METTQATQRTTERSEQAFAAAQRVLPGGVDSPVRAFGGVGGTPRFIARGQGSRLFDIDGNEFIDYVGSWGPLILGHADPRIVEAVTAAARDGSSFGAPTLAETALAEQIIECFPSMQKVRFVSSGTEATMSALRLARAATGRDLIVKFRGCYHGHVDSLLVMAGSGALTLGVPSSPGVPAAVAATTLLADYNDLAGAQELMADHGGEVAAIIVEPVAGNMGVVPPAAGFLEGLRLVCNKHGSLLIFDEVITGFRVALGEAQQLFAIQPDITCLGKIIGGGLPVGAYGGPSNLMDQLAPVGPVYQAGTLSGNPLAMAAGLATVKALREPGVYQRLESLSARLAKGLADAAKLAGATITLNRVGSMLTGFFNPPSPLAGEGRGGGNTGGQAASGTNPTSASPGPVASYAQATASDTARYAKFFHAMLNRGVYLAPSQYEAMFVSLAHSESDIDCTVEATAETLGSM